MSDSQNGPPKSGTRARLSNTLQQTVRFARRHTRRKPRSQAPQRRTLYYSAFTPLTDVEQQWCDRTRKPGYIFDHGRPATRDTFADLTVKIESAIQQGTYPLRIQQGSSGSHFCFNPQHETVGVFKPKNEEPYGKLNPKWTKWFHRNLCPCLFGRTCLIPNTGYLSEAAASLIDRRLGLYLVPRTEVVELAAPSFYYPSRTFRTAQRARNPRPLPRKVGSLQLFLQGFTDASTFLRHHPWLDRLCDPNSCALPDDQSEQTPLLASAIPPPVAPSSAHVLWLENGQSSPQTTSSLGPASLYLQHGDSPEADPETTAGADVPVWLPGPMVLDALVWTDELRGQFREELEKLVVLDYLIRNTDRGLDNWMIKYCAGHQLLCLENVNQSAVSSGPGHYDRPHIHIAAIDNGLAFPFKHPDEWRSYPYGWLNLPPSMTAGPFSTATRARFLPLLTSPQWWHDTLAQLQRLWRTDSDFNATMFHRQVAVLKGQAWNLIQTLRSPDEGPLDLCERPPVLISPQVVTGAAQRELLFLWWSSRPFSEHTDHGTLVAPVTTQALTGTSPESTQARASPCLMNASHGKPGASDSHSASGELTAVLPESSGTSKSDQSSAHSAPNPLQLLTGNCLATASSNYHPWPLSLGQTFPGRLTADFTTFVPQASPGMCKPVASITSSFSTSLSSYSRLLASIQPSPPTLSSISSRSTTGSVIRVSTRAPAESQPFLGSLPLDATALSPVMEPIRISMTLSTRHQSLDELPLIAPSTRVVVEMIETLRTKPWFTCC
ncbi:Phosphatidylinositol 4-kinase [Dimargaris verticillata]|uniref:Phosphatidylinositol 4-kinase n=1 Tax=Dimargaris verticillata TaxID=2761393 RepID=A0A9W8EG97_9FUNG|nr:Phosphatidylinositol 4-kinase [Dimargaris verticillata]